MQKPFALDMVLREKVDVTLENLKVVKVSERAKGKRYACTKAKLNARLDPTLWTKKAN